MLLSVTVPTRMLLSVTVPRRVYTPLYRGGYVRPCHRGGYTPLLYRGGYTPLLYRGGYVTPVTEAGMSHLSPRRVSTHCTEAGIPPIVPRRVSPFLTEAGFHTFLIEAGISTLMSERCPPMGYTLGRMASPPPPVSLLEGEKEGYSRFPFLRGFNLFSSHFLF